MPSYRITDRAAVRHALYIAAQPPRMDRWPRLWPRSRDQDASPTCEVKALLSRWPNSGRKATSMAVDVTAMTVYRARQALVLEGLEAALQHKPRPPKLDGVAQAELVRLTCLTPPPGRALDAEAAGRRDGELDCARDRVPGAPKIRV